MEITEQGYSRDVLEHSLHQKASILVRSPVSWIETWPPGTFLRGSIRRTSGLPLPRPDYTMNSRVNPDPLSSHAYICFACTFIFYHGLRVRFENVPGKQLSTYATCLIVGTGRCVWIPLYWAYWLKQNPVFTSTNFFYTEPWFGCTEYTEYG